MISYAEANAVREKVEAAVEVLSLALKAFPKGPMGLTPEAVKSSAKYQQTKAAFNREFAELRRLNAMISKAWPNIRRPRRISR